MTPQEIAYRKGFESKLAELVEQPLEKRAAMTGMLGMLGRGARALPSLGQNLAWRTGHSVLKMPEGNLRHLLMGPKGMSQDATSLGRTALTRAGVGAGAVGAYPAFDMYRDSRRRNVISNLGFGDRLGLALKLLANPQGVAQML